MVHAKARSVLLRARHAIIAGGASLAAAACIVPCAAADPRIDVQLYPPFIILGHGAVPWFAINNAGPGPALGSTAVQSLLGAAQPGILIVYASRDRSGNMAAVTTTLPGEITSFPANGYAGTAITEYFSHSSTAAAGSWNQSATAPVYYVGMYITCGASNVCLTAHPGSSPGSVVTSEYAAFLGYPGNTAAAAFGVTYPSTSLSFVWSIANAIAVGGSRQLIGPGITSLVLDGTGAPALSAVAAAISNATPLAPPAGASNLFPTPSPTPVPTATPTATPSPRPSPTPTPPPAYGVLNGPAGDPGATGVADGSASPATSGDFTATVLETGARGDGSFPSTGTGTSATDGALGSVPLGAAVTVPAGATLAIRNTLRNAGNVADTFLLAPAAGGGLGVPLPAGWTIACEAVNAAGTGPDPAHPYDASHPTPAVSAGSTLDYYTVYTAPATPTAMNAYWPYAANVVATSAGSGSARASDRTIHEIAVNGFVGMMKTVAVDNSGGCHSPTGYGGLLAPVCPGTKLTYTLTYRNVLPPNVGSGNVTITAHGLVISDDGSDPQTGWATWSTGLLARPVDSNGNAISYTASSLSVAVGSLGPGAAGTVTYSVVVR